MPKNQPVAHWLGVSFKADGDILGLDKAECIIWRCRLALPAQVVELAEDEEDQTEPARSVIRLMALQT